LYLYALFAEYIHILCICAVYIRGVLHLLHLRQPAVYPFIKGSRRRRAGAMLQYTKNPSLFFVFALQLDRNCDIVTLV
jgi:hypothetical protein